MAGAPIAGNPAVQQRLHEEALRQKALGISAAQADAIWAQQMEQFRQTGKLPESGGLLASIQRRGGLMPEPTDALGIQPPEQSWGDWWNNSLTKRMIVDPVVGAATLPGDVYAGRVDPASDEAVRRAFDLAGTLGTGGLATAPLRDAGAVGIFGGRLAKTANLETLAQAEALAQSGAYPDQIWEATGWFKGADGQWRFEIDDSKAVLGRPASERSYYDTAGAAIRHPDLWDAYPEMRSIDASVQRADEGAYYRPHEDRSGEGLFDIQEELRVTGRNDDEIRSNMLHELQHGVQEREGFTRGSSPRFHMQADGMTPEQAFNAYRATPGEIEARNVQSRRNMTPEERRDIPPAFTQDMQVVPGQLAPARGEQASIRAYHGSPHNFERFSSEKIGTGEGAQVYGHGLYFAENEGVATTYRPTSGRGTVRIDGRDASFDDLLGRVGITQDQEVYVGYLKQVYDNVGRGAPIKNAISEVRNDIFSFNTRTERVRQLEVWDKIEATLNSLDVKTVPGGHTYEVDIAAEPEQFLDWDKPLSEQSAKVREYLEREGFEFSQANPTGGDLVNFGGSTKKIVDELREAGVPGIRYLDQGSRISARRGIENALRQPDITPVEKAALEAELAEIPENSSNYVIFDDKIIGILRKYGMLPFGLAGAGAAAAQGSGQPPQL